MCHDKRNGKGDISNIDEEMCTDKKNGTGQLYQIF